MTDRTGRVVLCRIVSIIGTRRQWNPVDLVLGAHRVAKVSVNHLAQINIPATNRSQVQSRIGIIYGIIVPKEESVFHDTLEALGGDSRHPRGHYAIAVPKHVNVR